MNPALTTPTPTVLSAVTAIGEYGYLVFTCPDAADEWLGGLADRTLGCPECRQVHLEPGDAYGCCDTGQGVPMILRDGRWRRAKPAHLAY